MGASVPRVRSQIVLMAAGGMTDQGDRPELGTDQNKVGRWRRAGSRMQGVDGIAKERPFRRVGCCGHAVNIRTKTASSVIM